MATPTLKFVEPTVAESDLALKPEPVEIYGLQEAIDAAVAAALAAQPEG